MVGTAVKNDASLPSGLESTFLDRVFPFWFLFDPDMRVLAAGPSLQKVLPNLLSGTILSSVFSVVRPGTDFDFTRWVKAQDRLFILKQTPEGVILRGRVLQGEDINAALFLGSPWLTVATDLERLGLTLQDFALNDPIVDLLHLFQAERIAFAESQSLAHQVEARGRELEELNQKLTSQNASLQETERHLRETTAREKAILESALDAIITIDEGGTILTCNPATERLFGFETSELLGKNVSVLMPHPHAQKHDGYIRAYLETGHAKVIGKSREVLGQKSDGTQFPLELALGEVRHSDRRLFTGILRDISRRKSAETEAKRYLAELESSRENLEAALNQMRAGTVVIDRDDLVLFMNDACPIEVGLDRESLRGSLWYDVIPLDETSRQRVHELLRLQESDRTKEPLQCRLKDGRRFLLEGEVRDFPGDAARRILYLHDISELDDLKRQLSHTRFGSIVGESAAMQDLYKMIREVSSGDWSVLIEGETGSGKELVARSIHAASSRSSGPFIAVNCAGLTESLISSQLFGHVRGAFTGALSNQEGVFEAASGGTLFLDEIGDIPLATQSSLLRVLQEREIVRLGEVKPRKVNVRILTATHRDLGREVVEGRFRQDLLFRIRVARVRVPPLRERAEDIPLLAGAFLAECRVSTGKPIAGIAAEAMAALRRYSWPGNVRELKSTIESAAIHCQGSVIQVRELPREVVAAPTPQWPHPLETGDERERILEAIRVCGGHRGEAASLLGMSRATLYRKIAALGLDIKRTVRRK